MAGLPAPGLFAGLGHGALRLAARGGAAGAGGGQCLVAGHGGVAAVPAPARALESGLAAQQRRCCAGWRCWPGCCTGPGECSAGRIFDSAGWAGRCAGVPAARCGPGRCCFRRPFLWGWGRSGRTWKRAWPGGCKARHSVRGCPLRSAPEQALTPLGYLLLRSCWRFNTVLIDAIYWLNHLVKRAVAAPFFITIGVGVTALSCALGYGPDQRLGVAYAALRPWAWWSGSGAGGAVGRAALALECGGGLAGAGAAIEPARTKRREAPTLPKPCSCGSRGGLCSSMVWASGWAGSGPMPCWCMWRRGSPGAASLFRIGRMTNAAPSETTPAAATTSGISFLPE